MYGLTKPGPSRRGWRRTPISSGKLWAWDLRHEETEAAIGRYSADLVFREESTNRLVVVENLFGPSDHDRLGKLIVYAAGLETGYAVLLAPEFRDEHRAALDWLNSHLRRGLRVLRRRARGVAHRRFAARAALAGRREAQQLEPFRAVRPQRGIDSDSLLVECKSYSPSSYTPSGKIATLNESMLYFHAARGKFRKMMFIAQAPRMATT